VDEGDAAAHSALSSGKELTGLPTESPSRSSPVAHRSRAGAVRVYDGSTGSPPPRPQLLFPCGIPLHIKRTFKKKEEEEEGRRGEPSFTFQ